MPCCTTTAWPISSRPSSRAAATPRAMSAASSGDGARAPIGPSGASASPIRVSTLTTRKPSPSSSAMTARNSPSSPSARKPTRAKNLAARQSGRSDARDGRRTAPASTSSSTPASRSRRNPSPAAPSRTHACGASRHDGLIGDPFERQHEHGAGKRAGGFDDAQRQLAAAGDDAEPSRHWASAASGRAAIRRR